MDSDSWITLISIVLLIGCSAFFSACETAVSSFSKQRMKKSAAEGDKNAGLVLKALDNPDKTFASILIGKTIVNTAASVLGVLAAYLHFDSAKAAPLAVIVMSLALLILGEMIPKNLAKDYADKAALILIPFLSASIAFLSPLSFLFMKLASLFRGKVASVQAPTITEEELIYMMDTIEEEGVLEEQERDLVQSALEFDEISLREILTPRVNMVAIDVDTEHDTIRKIIVEEGYSRIPVYEKTIDKVIGVLYTRDFLLAILENREINLREMLGVPLFVHKGMKLSHLLASFKSRKVNLAVVVDEYGGTLGMVTMEDVLEELVGDIWDEDDEVPSGYSALDDGRFEFMGDYALDDMLELLDLTPDEDCEDFSTVGGWALHKLGHIPQTGESYTAFGYAFTVLEMDGHRLKRLDAKALPDEDEKDENNKDKGTSVS